MNYKKFVRLYSNSRVLRYYKAAGRRVKKTMLLYYGNQKIAQAFHPLLGTVEVILRNQLNHALTKHFSDPSWIINQKSGFMVAPSLTYVDPRTKKTKHNYYILKEVQSAEDKLKKTKATITPGRIIAEQSFGFWTCLYDKVHYTILKGAPGTIFTNMPTGYGRKDVANALTSIRGLRNRINHNEPICFDKNKCDFTYAREMYHTIIDLLSWIHPQIPSSLKTLDSVLSVIDDEEEKQRI